MAEILLFGKLRSVTVAVETERPNPRLLQVSARELSPLTLLCDPRAEATTHSVGATHAFIFQHGGAKVTVCARSNHDVVKEQVSQFAPLTEKLRALTLGLNSGRGSTSVPRNTATILISASPEVTPQRKAFPVRDGALIPCTSQKL